MADLSDLTAYLANAAGAAIYPNGTGQPSVAGADCLIYEGWPIGDQLDLDLKGMQLLPGQSTPSPRPGGVLLNVSVYPMPGTGVSTYQIQDETYVLVPATIGLTVVSVIGNVITVSGQPTQGEFLTVICDGANVLSQTGANTAALLAALAAQAAATYPGASSTATTLTIPVSTSKPIVVRQGGVATLGKVTHRQRHDVMLTTWTPDKTSRATLAKAIDVALKETIRITLPDTSQAKLCYSRTNLSDDQQSAGIYRRDLIFECEYATLQTFPGYTVTTVDTTVAVNNQAPINIPTAQAVT